MIYCLYGTEKIQIDEFVKNEIKKNGITNVSKYNLDDNTILDVLNDASYLDLFSENKAIILESKDIFNIKNDYELASFEKYLENPNNNTLLFLTVLNESLDERKKLVKIIRSKYKVHEFNKLKNSDVKIYIKNSLLNEGYTISDCAIELFINNIGTNYSLIYTEIEKLKVYKFDTKIIEENDIKNVVKKESESDVFKLVDVVLKNDKKKMISYYKELIDIGEDEIKLISLLAGEFRLLYQVKVLLQEGYKENDIVKELGIHPYRVKLAVNRNIKYKERKLLDCICSLYDIDYGIKTGNLIKENALLNFFLEI